MIITVFGASKIKENEEEYARAEKLGELLAKDGHTVCTGGYKGIMTAASKGAKEAGGKVIGVTTAQFPGKVNEYVDEERSFPTWAERLHQLIETGDAYVVFNGGTGTLVELFMTWEMLNKKMMHKPMFLLGRIPQEILSVLENEPLVLQNEKIKILKKPEEVVEQLASFTVS